MRGRASSCSRSRDRFVVGSALRTVRRQRCERSAVRTLRRSCEHERQPPDRPLTLTLSPEYGGEGTGGVARRAVRSGVRRNRTPAARYARHATHLPRHALPSRHCSSSRNRRRPRPPEARPRAADHDYFPPPDSRRLADPADAAQVRALAGIDPARLERAYDFTQRCSQNGGLLVVRHGYLVFERYFGRAHRNANPDMASTGKAFTSIACGIMLNEFKDKIPDGLDTKVFTEKYLPEAFPLDDPRRGEHHARPAAVHDRRLQRRRAAPDRRRHGQGRAAEAGAGAEHPRPRPVVAPRAALDRPGRGLFVLVAVAAHRVDRAAARDRHGAAGLHRRAAGQADGLGAVGLLPAPRRLRRCRTRTARAASRSTPPTRCASATACCTRASGATSSSSRRTTSRCATKPSPYNPHTPFSLQFEHNADGHVAGAPRDAFYKSGAGGFGIFVVPSLDLVIYKLGGKDDQYDPALTGIPAAVQVRRLARRLAADPADAVQRRQPGRRRRPAPGAGDGRRRRCGTENAIQA